jgi:hypothetical protein
LQLNHFNLHNILFERIYVNSVPKSSIFVAHAMEKIRRPQRRKQRETGKQAGLARKQDAGTQNRPAHTRQPVHKGVLVRVTSCAPQAVATGSVSGRIKP